MIVAEGELPPKLKVSCGMLGDQACLRLLWGGTWTAETTDGYQVFEPGEDGITLYFGTQTRRMPISVTGSYKVMTIQLTTGAPSVLGGPPQVEIRDRILRFDDLVGHGRLTKRIDTTASYEHWISSIEAQMRRFLKTRSGDRPNPLSLAFERQFLAAPHFAISGFAEAHGVSTRTLERTIARDFGISPKFVQRRARALDMAAHLLGVGRPEEEPEMRLRYFDQSHLIREIRMFFGMSPTELVVGPHPLLRLNLESRQLRRLRALEELEAQFSGAAAPWRDPSTEPPFAGGPH